MDIKKLLFSLVLCLGLSYKLSGFIKFLACKLQYNLIKILKENCHEGEK